MNLKSAFRKARKWLRNALRFLTPSKKTLKGAAWGILVLSLLIHLLVNLSYALHIGVLNWFIMIAAMTLVALLSGLLVYHMIKGLAKISRLMMVALVTAITVVMFSLSVNQQTTLFMLGNVVLIASLLGGSAWLLYSGYYKKTRTAYKVIILAALLVGLSGLIGGTWWFVHPGKAIDQPANAALSGKYLPEHLGIENPAMPGTYAVATLTYGSGTDKRRTEYGTEAGLLSPTADGTRFLDGWTGFRGNWRSRYFGFGKDSLPLNARVWYPNGEGPYPLVLIVHGNHLAQDYSDPGYAYLGQLLASRGYIFASVDQNFINGSFTDLFKGFGGENDARGWLMLKHLELWRSWNADSSHMFYQKVDMDKLALIGHSRGGEAVAHAALFNKLPYYPDNAKETFDFGFNIKALVAIAPADGQYQPSGILTPLNDINYFVLQGSHDADVQSYIGIKQFNRVGFSENFQGFKAGLYIYGANHGQFNTSWGRHDFSIPRINFINTGQLMPMEDQKQIAQVYISAFLDATLKGKTAYKALFSDHRTGRSWLPETIYLHHFEDASKKYVCSFDEDLDLTTATLAGGRISSENLTVWREQKAGIKWGDQGSKAVYIGWHRNPEDSITASYTIHLPADTLLNSDLLQPTTQKLLIMAVATVDENANPDPPRGEDEVEVEAERSEVPNVSEGSPVETEDGTDTQSDPIDFSIELVDAQGEMIRFMLSDCKYLQPVIKVKMGKLPFMSTAPDSEPVFDTFTFDLDNLSSLNVAFDMNELKTIRLVFDKSESGVIMVDHIGFMEKFVY